jgi:hypothetical protein
MTVGGENKVGAFCDLRGHDKLRVRLHGDFNSSGARSRGKPIFDVLNDDPDDVDTALA